MLPHWACARMCDARLRPGCVCIALCACVQCPPWARSRVLAMHHMYLLPWGRGLPAPSEDVLGTSSAATVEVAQGSRGLVAPRLLWPGRSRPALSTPGTWHGAEPWGSTGCCLLWGVTGVWGRAGHWAKLGV